MRAADIEHARGVGGLGEKAVDVAGQLHASLRAGLSQFLGSESSCLRTLLRGPERPPRRIFQASPAGERWGAS